MGQGSWRIACGDGCSHDAAASLHRIRPTIATRHGVAACISTDLDRHDISMKGKLLAIAESSDDWLTLSCGRVVLPASRSYCPERD